MFFWESHCYSIAPGKFQVYQIWGDVAAPGANIWASMTDIHNINSTAGPPGACAIYRHLIVEQRASPKLYSRSGVQKGVSKSGALFSHLSSSSSELLVLGTGFDEPAESGDQLFIGVRCLLYK